MKWKMKGSAFLRLFVIVASTIWMATEVLSETEDVRFHERTDFLVYGRTFAQATVDYPKLSLQKHRMAARAFPNMASCVEGGSDAPGTGSLGINWHAVSRLEELDICIFNAAKYFSEPEKLKAWLVRQGFNSVSLQSSDARSMKVYGASSAGWTVSGNMRRENFPQGFETWWNKFAAYSLSTSIVLDQSFQPVGVSSIFLRE